MKVAPPEELSPRIVSRDSPRESVADDRCPAIQARVIRWRDLVLAAWQLAGDEQYTGTLPEGLSSQQFWAKVTRAAKSLGGGVGVAVRGRRWWVWTRERGVLAAPRTKGASRKFNGLWKRLDTGETATVTGKLARRESRSLRYQADGRGWKLGIAYSKETGNTVVWRVAEGDAVVNSGQRLAWEPGER